MKWPPGAQARLIEALLNVERAARAVVMADPERTHGGLHDAMEELDETRAAIEREAER